MIIQLFFALSGAPWGWFVRLGSEGGGSRGGGEAFAAARTEKTYIPLCMGVVLSSLFLFSLRSIVSPPLSIQSFFSTARRLCHRFGQGNRDCGGIYTRQLRSGGNCALVVVEREFGWDEDFTAKVLFSEIIVGPVENKIVVWLLGYGSSSSSSCSSSSSSSSACRTLRKPS